MTNAMARGDKPDNIDKQIANVRPSSLTDQLPPVKKIVFLAEKTYTAITPQAIPPIETTMARMSHTQ